MTKNKFSTYSLESRIMLDAAGAETFVETTEPIIQPVYDTPKANLPEIAVILEGAITVEELFPDIDVKQAVITDTNLSGENDPIGVWEVKQGDEWIALEKGQILAENDLVRFSKNKSILLGEDNNIQLQIITEDNQTVDYEILLEIGDNETFFIDNSEIPPQTKPTPMPIIEEGKPQLVQAPRANASERDLYSQSTNTNWVMEENSANLVTTFVSDMQNASRYNNGNTTAYVQGNYLDPFQDIIFTEQDWKNLDTFDENKNTSLPAEEKDTDTKDKQSSLDNEHSFKTVHLQDPKSLFQKDPNGNPIMSVAEDFENSIMGKVSLTQQLQKVSSLKDNVINSQKGPIVYRTYSWTN